MRQRSVWGIRQIHPGVAEHRHLLERGRIWCPLHNRRDVDIRDCVACPWLVAARIEGATRWVRCAPPTTRPAGALLNKLMVLFILAPVVLVLKSFYALSFAIFATIVPYGLFIRHLAVRAVRQHLQNHPEERDDFEQAGIISC